MIDLEKTILTKWICGICWRRLFKHVFVRRPNDNKRKPTQKQQQQQNAHTRTFFKFFFPICGIRWTINVRRYTCSYLSQPMHRLTGALVLWNRVCMLLFPRSGLRIISLSCPIRGPTTTNFHPMPSRLSFFGLQLFAKYSDYNAFAAKILASFCQNTKLRPMANVTRYDRIRLRWPPQKTFKSLGFDVV